MPPVPRRPALAAAALALLVASLAPAAPLRAQPAPVAGPPAPPPKPVALVISGGVSLGAYQAGVTYALLRYLKERRRDWKGGPPDPNRALRVPWVKQPANVDPGLVGDRPVALTIATGSSAGNINAFLAALTWCDEQMTGPANNLFWESWGAVGFDKLAPAPPDQAAYRKLFDAKAVARNLGTPSPDFPVDPPKGVFAWKDDQPIYSNEDGLLTRRAFLAAQRHLTARLDQARYRDCLVRVGLTATNESPVSLQEPDGQGHGDDTKTQRFVVPLLVASKASGKAGLEVRNLIGGEWEQKDHRSIGRAMGLPQAAGAVAPALVIDLVKASSAFPVAFAPQPLPVCLGGLGRKGVAGAGCPSGYRRAELRFIDGGIFDNIPLGLALELAGKPTQRLGEDPTYVYVDDGLRRGALELPPARRRSRGLSFVASMAGRYVKEARSYELQGLARFRSQDIDFEQRFLRSTRFFPLVGSYLVAFGAFLDPSFRKHDYYVGIYDGVMTLATELAERGLPLGNPGPPAPADVDRYFPVVRDLLLDGDQELRRFVDNLHRYERYWTTPAGTEGADYWCARPSGALPASAPERASRADAKLWTVFRALCTMDERARRLRTTGNERQLAEQLDQATSLGAFLRALEPRQQFLGDLDRFTFQATDRAVRRAIDVERQDGEVIAEAERARKARGEAGPPLRHSRVPERVMIFGRLLLASGLERDREVLDLDPSSVARISAGSWPLTQIFHLFPYYALWDIRRSAVELGYEPKLRYGPRVFTPFGGALKWSPYTDDGTLSWKLSSGLGCDPRGRLLDDLQLGPAFWFNPGQGERWTVGGELGGHLLGSKVRVTLGLPALHVLERRGAPPAAEARWWDGWYVGLGFGDLNGLIAWAARSSRYLTGIDEEHGESSGAGR